MALIGTGAVVLKLKRARCIYRVRDIYNNGHNGSAHAPDDQEARNPVLWHNGLGNLASGGIRHGVKHNC